MLQAVRQETAALLSQPAELVAEPAEPEPVPATEAALGIVAAVLLKVCPLDTGKAQRCAWAAALESAVLARHASSQEIKTHVRNLRHNLRSNGTALARYDPVELAALSNEQLGEDVAQDRLRGATGCSWRVERLWSGSYAEPPPALSASGAWHVAAGSGRRRRLVLATRGIDVNRKAIPTQLSFQGLFCLTDLPVWV